MPDAPDTTNDHLVGVQNKAVTMVLPPTRPMGVEEALRMAAWVVMVASAIEPDAEEQFTAVLDAIKRT